MSGIYNTITKLLRRWVNRESICINDTIRWSRLLPLKPELFHSITKIYNLWFFLLFITIHINLIITKINVFMINLFIVFQAMFQFFSLIQSPIDISLYKLGEKYGHSYLSFTKLIINHSLFII